MHSFCHRVRYEETIQRQREALRTPLPVVVQQIGTAPSYRLAAVVCDMTDTTLLRDWAAGDTIAQDPDAEDRLRTAYEIPLLRRPLDSDEVIRAWIIGMEPTLNDESPALVLCEGRFTDAGDAAYAFAAEG